MTVTAVYSHANEAFNAIARAHRLVPFDVRLLVALHERGGEGRTDELEVDMQTEGTAIRRSYPPMAARRLLAADAGSGTTRPKRGVRTRLTLTTAGRNVALAALTRAETDRG